MASATGAVMSPDPQTVARTCSSCGKVWGNPLSVCRCEQVRYCDRDCQRNDWPKHKRRCREKADVGKEFSKLGVRLSFVRKLFKAEDVGEMTTDQVVLNLILRDTIWRGGKRSEYNSEEAPAIQERLSMVEVLLKDPETTQNVGTASSYVIHAWRYPWRDLMNSLSHSDLDPERFIWLDALCVNQHEALTTELPEWWYHGVHDVIESCSHVELVLLPWDCPVPVRRSWCVWEILGAMDKSPDHIKVLVTPEEKHRLEQGLRMGKIAFETFQRVFADINIERAETTNERDHLKITREIKSIGAVRVNDVVMLPVKQWLTTTVDRFQAEAMDIEGNRKWSDAERCNVLNGRAELYHALGRLEIASKCFEDALDQRLKTTNGSIATLEVNQALNNLAAVYMDMGKFDKAQTVLDRATRSCSEISSAMPVSSSPVVKKQLVQKAMTLGNCALNLHHQGKLSQARQLYEEAIRIDEQLKMRDGETAVRLNNSAKLLQDMGDYKLAQRRFELAMPILLEMNGEDHPSVATLQNNLALVACAMGNLEEARVKFEQALESLKRTLGSAHPLVAGALNNSAAILNSQGFQAQACAYFQEALKIQKAALGQDHPDVATTMNNLATVYNAMGDSDKALELGKEALRIWKTSTGTNSPQTKAAKKLWGGDQPRPPPGSPLLRYVATNPVSGSPLQGRRKGSVSSSYVPGRRLAAASSVSSSPAASPKSSPVVTAQRKSTVTESSQDLQSKTKKKKKRTKSKSPSAGDGVVNTSSLAQVVSMLTIGEDHSTSISEQESPKLNHREDEEEEDFDFQRMVAKPHSCTEESPPKPKTSSPLVKEVLLHDDVNTDEDDYS